MSNPPDYELKPVAGPGDDAASETPRVYKMVRREAGEPTGRREFFNRLATAAGVAAGGAALASCDSKYSVVGPTAEGVCLCHVVCSCDVQQEGKKRSTTADWTDRYTGSVCVCHSVCTCNAVCTCDTVCTCDSQGGSDTYTYSYHYWYPN
jgi:hypothetical protein